MSWILLSLDRGVVFKLVGSQLSQDFSAHINRSREYEILCTGVGFIALSNALGLNE
jgi:hypothetical protein